MRESRLARMHRNLGSRSGNFRASRYLGESLHGHLLLSDSLLREFSLLDLILNNIHFEAVWSMHQPHLSVMTLHIISNIVIREGRHAFASIIEGLSMVTGLSLLCPIAIGILGVFVHLLRVHPVVDTVYDW